MIITRNSHIAWCRTRALEYLDRGDIDTAWISMASDLSLYNGTINLFALHVGTMLKMAGKLNTEQAMKDFLEGVK